MSQDVLGYYSAPLTVLTHSRYSLNSRRLLRELIDDSNVRPHRLVCRVEKSVTRLAVCLSTYSDVCVRDGDTTGIEVGTSFMTWQFPRLLGLCIVSFP